jgi:hypothetical protein
MSNEVNPTGLGERILELLRLGPGAEVELQVLRDGSVMARKVNE